MAKRFVRLIILFALALAFVPALPLYVERTLLRSFLVGNAGDRIDWGWKLTSLTDYWSNYNYMAREQRPALWLTIDISLALVYALIVASGLDQLFGWMKRRRTKQAATSFND